MRTAILVIGAVIISMAACKKETGPSASNPSDTPAILTPYVLKPIPHFPQMIVPDDNQPFVEKIQLGRMLYYDPILSNDGRACASCHVQANGFTSDVFVYNMPVLPHVNLGWNRNFM